MARQYMELIIDKRTWLPTLEAHGYQGQQCVTDVEQIRQAINAPIRRRTMKQDVARARVEQQARRRNG